MGEYYQANFNFIEANVENDKRSAPNNIHIDFFIRLAPAKPTPVYRSYWYFAAERQNIFFKRINGKGQPWSEDPIFQKYKFTNAYRASDRVSQYLIKKVIYNNKFPDTIEEVFFRVILFKLFNKIETWELLSKKIGLITYSDFTVDKYADVLNDAFNQGKRIFSAAYIMPSGSKIFGAKRKHLNCLLLLDKMMVAELPLRIAECRRMQQAFELLRSYPMIGDFLAYQFVTDLNYSNITTFSENEFVVPGPGAKNGIRKCFKDLGGLTEEEAIKFMVDRQEEEFSFFGLDFQSLWGRNLQLIDCQNLFCEVDKYSRVAHPEISGKDGRKRIKQIFKPNYKKIGYWYPPKWQINSFLNKDI